ncbi:reductive dehalogenase [Dehalogenimonas lykanthroporepellens BL-DC-9]|nr:reductive dehalogenase [Dehalogenimonas lykanthroporepellens BL-DC-9]
MTKFHSTVSRRDFMKGLGLAGAGLGSAALVAPGFKDLDEAIGATNNSPKPWWVKTVDQPMVDIDYSLMERYDQREGAFQIGLQRYFGNGDVAQGTIVVNEQNKLAGEAGAKLFNEGKPGYALRDVALTTARGAMSGGYSFLGRQKAATPQDRGVAKWQGNPEENFNMLRNAAKIWGATHFNVVELEPGTTKKFVWSWDHDGRKIEFEDVDVPYLTADKKAIPNAIRYAVVFYVPGSIRTNTRVAEAMGDIARCYEHFFNIQNQLMEFIRGLGYQSVGQTSNQSLTTKTAMAVLGGSHEQSRMLSAIAPIAGPTPRPGMLFTDLPLAPTKPIDAGIHRFCATCMKCAHVCPTKSISFDKEPTYEIIGGFNMKGAKRFQVNGATCRAGANDGVVNPCRLGNWNTCMRQCTFSKLDDAMIHEIIHMTVSSTSLFNGFFANMDDFFGYNTPITPDEWWTEDMLPFDQDLTQGQWTGT